MTASTQTQQIDDQTVALSLTQAWSMHLLAWFDQAGRKDLPWQVARTPYRVWVSEIMLQQTQVTTVIGYFERFMVRFPTLESLAMAPVDEVLHLWTGLGYYARARNLHRAAQQVLQDHAGVMPIDLASLQALPGIGRSTAAAILAQAHGQRQAILDGNVKRVLARALLIEGDPARKTIENELWRRAEQLTPHERVADYTQAIMDLGALICTRHKPQCQHCPVQAMCGASAQQRQDELPHKKRKATRRLRIEHALVACDARGRVLLAQRPPTGVWGGLWACPQFTNESALYAWQRQHLPQAMPLSALPMLTHAFTHFDLHLHLHAMQVDLPPTLADGDRYCWYDRRRPERIGVPKPMLDIFSLLSRVTP